MFLITIDKLNKLYRDDMRRLAHYSFNINAQLICNIFYEKKEYEIIEVENTITLRKISVCKCDLFVYNHACYKGTITKNFMLSEPLYIYEKNNLLLVSSNIKLLHEYGIKTEVDHLNLPEYFVFRYIAPPHTLYKDIITLPIGCSFNLSVDSSGIKSCGIKWTEIFNSPSDLSISTAAQTLASVLESKTIELTPFKNNIACLLSGGMDSSIIYMSAKDRLSLKGSHSTGYPFEKDEENGELIYATTAAEALGSKHTYHKYSNGQFLHGLIDSIYQAEMPVVHLQSILLSLLFNNSLDDKEKIIMCGQGADGLVGLNIMFNYHHYEYLIKPYLAPLLFVASKIFTERFFPFQKFYKWSKHKWDLEYNNPNHAIWLLGVFGDIDWVIDHYNVNCSDIFKNRYNVLDNINPSSVLDAFSTLDFMTDVAVTQDVWSQIALQSGRNVYYSFNEEEIIKTTSSVNWSEKLSDPKRLMYLLGAELNVPEFILKRPKIGFGVRSSLWANEGGLSEPLLKIIEPVVDIELVRSFQGADEKRAMLLWNWINYGIWKRLFINWESVDDLQEELSEAIKHHK